MNKARIEAFTDAILAILVTIMVLEFHVPKTADWQSLVKENGVYFIAYVIAFADVSVSWYNHHYLLALAERINKAVYWSNMLWMFTLSLIPFAVAFISEHPANSTPAIFYLAVNIAWALSYLNLSQQIARANNSDIAKKIQLMPIYSYLHSSWLAVYPLAFVILFFWPPIVIVMGAIEIIIAAFKSNNPEIDFK
ncbi:DUF1211 domain-containing protein [Oenococcus sicerae]|uniref:DUF1211 domain-containing protein n=1 Tax=Oenococcus sicerae TaxID=2203724 RepID=A0ABX5QL12_9LACO|nr:TMEM175 family protein [Oenococcus sicerae]QAS69484.1 DUF1211 domain-containing protein [Oenococcus sicerae]